MYPCDSIDWHDSCLALSSLVLNGLFEITRFTPCCDDGLTFLVRLIDIHILDYPEYKRQCRHPDK